MMMLWKIDIKQVALHGMSYTSLGGISHPSLFSFYNRPPTTHIPRSQWHRMSSISSAQNLSKRELYMSDDPNIISVVWHMRVVSARYTERMQGWHKYCYRLHASIWIMLFPFIIGWWTTTKTMYCMCKGICDECLSIMRTRVTRNVIPPISQTPSCTIQREQHACECSRNRWRWSIHIDMQ